MFSKTKYNTKGWVAYLGAQTHRLDDFNQGLTNQFMDNSLHLHTPLLEVSLPSFRTRRARLRLYQALGMGGSSLQTGLIIIVMIKP